MNGFQSKMFANQLFRVFLLGVLFRSVYSSYRRIKDGKRANLAVRYMVYLTKAEESETLYDAWICGGAIVSTSFIVTSAACVEDVKHMYAISGYSKYVNVDDIRNNECTKASMKKIVFICIPKRYDFAYEPIIKWAFIDIAAVKVEKPYDFSAPVLPGCSWQPDKIEINYDARYQAPDTDAIILGWGHEKKWRKPGDTTDYNQENLQYSSILIMHKPECKRLYLKTPELLPVIDKYMICAMKEGNLNLKGEPISEKTKPLANGCPPGYRRDDNECEEPYESITENNKESLPLKTGPESQYPMEDEINSDKNSFTYHRPKSPPSDDLDAPKLFKNPEQHNNPTKYGYRNQQTNTTNYNFVTTKLYASQNQQIDPTIIDNPVTKNPYTNQNHKNNPTKDNPFEANPGEYDDDDVVTFEDIILRRSDGNETNRFRYTRKAGICQNDHGGPLVTFVGRHERLIGVASVFRLDKKSHCVGPYLFTSTQCNGAFLDCTINENEEGQGFRRQSFCDLPPDKRGFDVVKRTISWKNHRDGPAHNELNDG